MKKKLLIVFSIAALIVFGLLINTNNTSVSEIDKLREQHMAFLNNSPFKETLKLSKKERKAHGVPPNKYNEEMWSLTIDPSTGRPHPERVLALQESLLANRVPGETATPWEERGPDNIGGRTRAIMFDPNDATNTRVFAGGVSGGLWVNEDITDVNSAWSEVDIPQNLGISCITYDPNDIDTFYVGTGESYVFGDVNGNGVWKSTDAGLTWTQVFGGVGTVIPGTISNMTINSPASIAGDYSFVPANFGPTVGSFSGNLVLANDGTGTPTLGCSALVNPGAINGNIAVIQRGTCEFGVKVLNAENAGAVAVIVINNIAGGASVMGPGAVGNTVTIPSFMISQADGAGILTELGNNVTVNVSVVGGTDTFVTGISHINDIVVRDVGSGNSEVFVAASDSFFRYSPGAPPATPRTTFGNGEFGLFKSVDAGGNWDELVLNTGQGNPFMPNDLEIAADNKIWVSTTNSTTYGTGGGRILSSSDGTTFALKHNFGGDTNRTQIAVSGTNAGTVYALAHTSGGPLQILKTTNEFASETALSLPNDIDGGIPANDFANTQGWYDLLLALDPTDDDKFYVGGINLFRSDDSASNWVQVSEAYTSTSLNDVHPDQHSIAFGNNDSSKMLFGNDGGVYYSANSGGLIQARNLNYNVLQFYKGAIGPNPSNEKLLAGAQDNNTLLLNNATSGINSATVVHGGDGAFCFIDRDQGYMVTSSQNGNFRYLNYTSGAFQYTIDGSSPGQFINPAALDSDNNILYSATPSAQLNRYVLGTNSLISTTPLTNALLVSPPTAFKPSTFTTTTLFVGTSGGKLLKLTNANTSPTWSDITGSSFLGSISCIELGETEDDIYVTFYNYGVTSIFFSDDGGATWNNKESDLPDFPVRAILANPLNSDEVIVGTELGVWATPNFNDASPNWYQAQNGMKDVKVTSFDLRSADNVVLATTYGRGMFTGQFTAEASGLSVDEFSQNDLIKIYPTVSNGNITISRNSEIREGDISIFDINGRTVHSAKVNFDNGLEQPLSLNLSSGMYVVKFAANGLQSSHKIIIE